MTGFRKIHPILLILVLVGLGLSTEAKADVVTLTLTPTTYDAGTGSFTIQGFFTNSGNLTFQPGHFDLVFTPDFVVPYGISTNTILGESSPISRPVPGMSSTPVLPLLNFGFFTQPQQGTYIGTLSVSGFDASGVAITTGPVQFTVNVPVPEPTTALLLTTGLVTLTAFLRRRHDA